MFGSGFNPLELIFSLIALVIAITVHEFSHALVADRLGDPTPRLQGRLTLNPFAHLDPLGTIMLLLVRFGWGKPVVFDPFNLRNPRRDAALISIAGPIANILLAALCSIILYVLFGNRLSILSSSSFSGVLFIASALLQTLVVLNVILAVFNLVPVHPLDGFKIVGGILPAEYAKQWYELERYGIIFLLFLIFPIFGGIAPINRLISPLISAILRVLLPGGAII